MIGQSGDPLSPYSIDHLSYRYRGITFRLPFSEAAVTAAAAHTLRLVPQQDGPFRLNVAMQECFRLGVCRWSVAYGYLYSPGN